MANTYFKKELICLIEAQWRLSKTKTGELKKSDELTRENILIEEIWNFSFLEE